MRRTMSFRNARACKLAASSAVLLLAVLSIPLTASMSAKGDALYPLIVDGTVTDEKGRPMEGVPVVVTADNGGTPVSHTNYTDANGLYSVTFGQGEWDVGYSIQSVATWGGEQVSDDLVASGDPVETIDLMFPFEIPQFGTLLGFLAVAAVVGAVAVFLLPRRSKRAKQ
jgi:hypothetical protein